MVEITRVTQAFSWHTCPTTNQKTPALWITVERAREHYPDLVRFLVKEKPGTRVFRCLLCKLNVLAPPKETP
jgi:hypothetical protein